MSDTSKTAKIRKKVILFNRNCCFRCVTHCMSPLTSV